MEASTELSDLITYYTCAPERPPNPTRTRTLTPAPTPNPTTSPSPSPSPNPNPNPNHRLDDPTTDNNGVSVSNETYAVAAELRKTVNEPSCARPLTRSVRPSSNPNPSPSPYPNPSPSPSPNPNPNHNLPLA
eukprot:scaffold52445_cov38-Phaeocystis_antarctica.AAC.1